MIIITDLIRSQIYEALIMFCSGIAFMLIYEIFSFIKHAIKARKWFDVMLELIFWIAASFLISAFLYYCAFGQLSFHVFCAFVLGALLWKCVFYGIIDSGEKNVQKENSPKQSV